MQNMTAQEVGAIKQGFKLFCDEGRDGIKVMVRRQRKGPYYTAPHTTPHTTLRLNKNREVLRQRKVRRPPAIARGGSPLGSARHPNRLLREGLCGGLCERLSYLHRPRG
jgi:hypothetical protein